MKRAFRELFFLSGKRTALAIFSAGLALRIFFLYRIAGFPLGDDALAYHQLALQLLHHEIYQPSRPPGLSYYLSLCYRIFGPSEFAGEASMLFFYALFSLFLFIYLRRIWNDKAANLALACCTFYPAHVFHSVWPLTQLPTAVLLIIALYLLEVIGQKKWLLSATLGFVLAFLTLIRPSNILFLLLIPLWFIIRYKKDGICLALVTILASLILPAGYLAKVHSMTGSVVFINYFNSMNFYLGNNQYTPLYKTWWFGSHGAGQRDVPEQFTREREKLMNLPWETQDRLYYQNTVVYLLSRPDRFILRTLNRIRCFFAFDTYTGTKALKFFKVPKITALSIFALDSFFYISIMLASLIFLVLFRDSNFSRERLALLLSVVVLYSFPYWISFSHPTYHFPVVPIFAIFAAVLGERLFSDQKILEKVLLALKSDFKLMLVIIFFIYIQIEWILVMWPSYATLP